MKTLLAIALWLSLSAIGLADQVKIVGSAQAAPGIVVTKMLVTPAPGPMTITAPDPSRVVSPGEVEKPQLTEDVFVTWTWFTKMVGLFLGWMGACHATAAGLYKRARTLEQRGLQATAAKLRSVGKAFGIFAFGTPKAILDHHVEKASGMSMPQQKGS